MGLASLPAIKQVLGKGPQIKNLMNTLQKRMSVLVYTSIAGLLITGLLMARRSPDFDGLFTFSTTYSALLAVKHLLVLAMTGIALWRSLVLGRNGGPSTPQQEKLSARLLVTNMVLGVAVLLASGFLAGIAALPAVI
jgi:putative copper export protein